MENIKPKIVLTGGGTGGHVIPALALLPELKKSFSSIAYIGGDGIEKRLAMDAGLNYFEIKTVGFNRSHLLKNFKLPYVLCKSVSRAKSYLKDICPDVVFSKGGYIGLPVVIAAKQLKIPVVAHESDLSLGLANKISYAFGAQIITSFQKTAVENKNFLWLGFPVREALFNGNKNLAKKSLNLTNSRPTLLVIGGSTGSAAINNSLLEALPTLLKTYNVVHITGKNKAIDYKAENYCQLEYAENIGDLLALADVVVSRAGAGAISELGALKKSAVLIPLPKGNSRGDQVENAEFAKDYGAIVLKQKNLSSQSLIDAINTAEKTQMRPFSPPANVAICDLLLSLAQNKPTR